jgi:hypothetical protein
MSGYCIIIKLYRGEDNTANIKIRARNLIGEAVLKRSGLAFSIFLPAVLLFVWFNNTVQSGGSLSPTNHILLQVPAISNNFRGIYLCSSGKGLYPSACIKEKQVDRPFDAFIAYPGDCMEGACNCAVFLVSYSYSGRLDVFMDGKKCESLRILPGQIKWTASTYNIGYEGKINISSPGTIGSSGITLVLNRKYAGFMAGDYLFLKGRDTKVARTFGDRTVFSLLPDGRYSSEISAVFISDAAEKMDIYYSAARYAAIVHKNEFSIAEPAGEKLKVLRNSGDLLPGNDYKVICMVFDADRNMTGGTVWDLTYKP